MPSLIKDKKTGIYKVRDRRGGRDIIQSLGTTSKDLAEGRYAKWLAGNDGDKWKEVEHTFDDAVVLTTAEHFPTIRPNTRKAYTFHLLALAQTFQGMKLGEIKRGSLNSHVQRRRRDGVSNDTIRIELAVLSVVFDMAYLSEWVEHNPVRLFIKTLRKRGLIGNPPRDRYLSHEEEARLLEATRTLDRERFHNADMWLAAARLTIAVGFRSAELRAARWQDVDFYRKEITIIGKGGKKRVVPLLPAAEKVLRALSRPNATPYLVHRSDGSPFGKWSGPIETMTQAAGIENLTWHDLRRTCGCRLLQDRKLRMEEVSAWLGHSSVKVTERVYAFLRVDDLHAPVGTVRGVSPLNNRGETAETMGNINGLRLLKLRRRA